MKATKEGSATLVSGMPKIDEVIKKFGAHERENPPFVIVGLIKLPSTGWNGGILAFAMTEWSAYSIRNILNPYGNDAVLVGTLNITQAEKHMMLLPHPTLLTTQVLNNIDILPNQIQKQL